MAEELSGWCDGGGQGAFLHCLGSHSHLDRLLLENLENNIHTHPHVRQIIRVLHGESISSLSEDSRLIHKKLPDNTA